jgi:hypothetical protein
VQLRALFDLLAWYNLPLLVEWTFKDTVLEGLARNFRLGREALSLNGSGHRHASLAMFEALAKEFPQDPGAIFSLGRFLVFTREKELEDPVRGIRLLEKALAMSRDPRSPFARQAPLVLEAMARGHYLKGDTAEAVRRQKEALRALPAGTEDMKVNMQRSLREYQRALEGK